MELPLLLLPLITHSPYYILPLTRLEYETLLALPFSLLVKYQSSGNKSTLVCLVVQTLSGSEAFCDKVRLNTLWPILIIFRLIPESKMWVSRTSNGGNNSLHGAILTLVCWKDGACWMLVGHFHSFRSAVELKNILFLNLFKHRI